MAQFRTQNRCPPLPELLHSRAVVQGDWCFVARATGYDYKAMTMPETVEQQARACLTTIATVLEEAGFARRMGCASTVI